MLKGVSTTRGGGCGLGYSSASSRQQRSGEFDGEKTARCLETQPLSASSSFWSDRRCDIGMSIGLILRVSSSVFFLVLMSSLLFCSLWKIMDSSGRLFLDLL